MRDMAEDNTRIFDISSNRSKMTPTAKSPSKKRLTLFSRRVNENGEKEESLEVRGLISPRLEKELQKDALKGRSSLVSPVRSLTNALRSLSSPKKSLKTKEKPAERGDYSGDHYSDDSCREDEEDDNDEELENNLSQDELMVLLARELQLIDDGDENNEYDDDEK